MTVYIDSNTFGANPALYADAEKTKPLPRVLPAVQLREGKLNVAFLGDRAPTTDMALSLSAVLAGTQTQILAEYGDAVDGADVPTWEFPFALNSQTLADVLADKQRASLLVGVIATAEGYRREWQILVACDPTATGEIDPEQVESAKTFADAAKRSADNAAESESNAAQSATHAAEFATASAQSARRAELVERYRDQTYCELTIEKVDGYNTSRLPRIEAIGLWSLDLDDGNGAQMRIDDNVQVEFEWGEQTQKTVRIYGAVTKIYFNASDVDGDYRYANRGIYCVSKILESTARIFVFPGGGGEILVDSDSYSTGALVGFSADSFKNWTFTYANRGGLVLGRKGNFDGALSGWRTEEPVVVSNTGIAGNIGGLNSSMINNLSLSVDSDDVGFYFVNGNLNEAKFNYFNPSLVSTTRGFWTDGLRAITSLSFRGAMPKLSDAPNLFVNTALDADSIVGVLNKLPRYTDSDTHRIGFTTTTANTGIAHTDTTETFTVADDDGTEYSVDNCPLFTNDDEYSTLRKAYVLAIAKKGWEVLI